MFRTLFELILSLMFLSLVAGGCAPSFQVSESENLNSEDGQVEACEQDLISVYQQTYHQFLTQNCSACHIPGGVGKGAFASVDLIQSYDVFKKVDFAHLNSNAVSVGHNPPYTGPQNQATIDSIKPVWEQALADYDQCKAQAPEEPAGIKTTDKLISANQTGVTLTWNLQSELSSNGTLPSLAGAILKIRARLVTLATGETVYYFSSPELTAGAVPLHIQEIQIQINQKLVTTATTFRAVDRWVPAQGTRTLSSATMIIAQPVSQSDTVAITIRTLETGEFNPPTYTQLKAAGGVFGQNCLSCHTGAGAQAGLDLTSYNSIINQGAAVPYQPDASLIWVRMNSSQSPMPASGVLPAATRQLLRDWILDGAPNN